MNIQQISILNPTLVILFHTVAVPSDHGLARMYSFREQECSSIPHWLE